VCSAIWSIFTVRCYGKRGTCRRRLSVHPSLCVCLSHSGTSTDFGNVWHRYCRKNMLLNGNLLSPLSQLMSLHYLGIHEPRKWVSLVMLKNDTILVCYIFNTHRPIMIIFCTQYGHTIKYSMQIIIISRLAIFVLHQFVKR